MVHWDHRLMELKKNTKLRLLSQIQFRAGWWSPRIRPRFRTQFLLARCILRFLAAIHCARCVIDCALSFQVDGVDRASGTAPSPLTTEADHDGGRAVPTPALPHFKFNADNGGDLFFVGTGVVDAFCRGRGDALRVDLHDTHSGFY